ncbi:MAG TPA: hypothetical protein VMJ31_05505, partial [Methylocystis sp.]|nr:hypothetical protein [Methylocystis sp.]
MALHQLGKLFWRIEQRRSATRQGSGDGVGASARDLIVEVVMQAKLVFGLRKKGFGFVERGVR